MDTKLMMNLAAGFGFLIPCVVWDIRTQLIPVWYLTAGLLLGTAGRIVLCIMGSMTVMDTMLSLLPGGFLLLMALVTREKIGLGDGAAFLVLGLLEGGRICMAILLFSFLLSSVYGGILLVSRKGSRNQRIPFIPFVMGGLAVGALCLLI